MPCDSWLPSPSVPIYIPGLLQIWRLFIVKSTSVTDESVRILHGGLSEHTRICQDLNILQDTLETASDICSLLPSTASGKMIAGIRIQDITLRSVENWDKSLSGFAKEGLSSQGSTGVRIFFRRGNPNICWSYISLLHPIRWQMVFWISSTLSIDNAQSGRSLLIHPMMV